MALILAFGFAAINRLAVLPLLFAVAFVLVLASGQPARVARSLRAPLVLACAFALILPLVAGESVLWQAGPLRIRAEGLQSGLLIGGRLLAIVAVTLALLSTLPPHHLAAGLRGLRVPALVADLLLLTLRYLDELRGEFVRAGIARRLRGGRSGWRDLPALGATLAAALIRSQRRAETVWAAMRLRGHASGLTAPLPPLAGRDWAAIGVVTLLAALVLAADRVG